MITVFKCKIEIKYYNNKVQGNRDMMTIIIEFDHRESIIIMLLDVWKYIQVFKKKVSFKIVFVSFFLAPPCIYFYICIKTHQVFLLLFLHYLKLSDQE